jgi:RNA polymerase sigma factor (sigma-70 family)
LDSNEFLKKYDPFIKGFAYKFCKYPEDEQDFAQELRIRLWKAYEEHFDPAKGKLSTWVYQTLLLHSRKLRFDMKKQEVFNKEMLNSEYYHSNHYRQDTYFLYIAELLGRQQSNAENKYPQFERKILELLTPEEKRVYTLLMRYAPGIKISRISRELRMKKEAIESLYGAIKEKVLIAYEQIYNI